MTDATPAAPPPHDYGLTLVVPGRKVALAEGWTWVAEGWKLFTRAPLMWIVAFVLAIVLFVVVGIVPFVGMLISPLLQTILAAGFMIGCRALETEGELEIEHLFAGFSRGFAPLAILGLYLLAGTLVVAGITFIIMLGLMGVFFSGYDLSALAENPLLGGAFVLLGVLLYLALLLPVMAAYWFAPALVALNGMRPVDAMKASFFACFRNFVTFTVYSLVMLGALIVALIPFGLGLLVWVPLTIASTYVAYRRIFTEDAAPTSTGPQP